MGKGKGERSPVAAVSREASRVRILHEKFGGEVGAYADQVRGGVVIRSQAFHMGKETIELPSVGGESESSHPICKKASR